MEQEAPATREEILEFYCASRPTEPDRLDWERLLGFLTDTYRLRMNITEQTISEELLEAARTYRYPPVDVPEVVGLLRVLSEACEGARVGYRLEPGPREIQTGFVGFFEPQRIRLGFRRATLALAIAPGEFQWILKGTRRETAAAQLESFKRGLVLGTRDWLRRGNR